MMKNGGGSSSVREREISQERGETGVVKAGGGALPFIGAGRCRGGGCWG
jgi:hypothetical protein